ncbi:MAG: DMT family transporter [Spirochaetia bacterium]|nr:DMT family transporter [Spirochaetia bacterium]
MKPMQNKQMGVLYIVLSGFFFALVMLFIKLAGPLPTMQKALFRNLIALGIALIILGKTKTRFTWDRKDFPVLLLRGLAGTIGLVANFYAVDHLILSDATILNKLAPFFVIIFSRIFLKEKVTATQMLLVFGAFLGASLVVKPAFSNTDPFPYLIGILGGIAAGAAYTCVRELGNRSIPAAVIVAFFSLFSTLVITPFVIADHQSMGTSQILYLLLAGVSAAGGQFSITKAYAYAPAKEISVYDYTQILFASLLSIFIFSEYPDALSIGGYLIVTAMATLMFLHTKRKA